MGSKHINGKNSIESKILKINWNKYLEPKYYNSDEMYFSPERLIKALITLNNETDVSFGFHNEILFALGNNHRGTYYPATLEAIDIITEIEKTSKNEAMCDFVKSVLNDLYYFQLEMNHDDKELFEEIESSIREKLQPYSDENH